MKTQTYTEYLVEKLRAYHEAESVPRGGPKLTDEQLYATYSGSNVAMDITVAYICLRVGEPLCELADGMKDAAIRLGQLGKDLRS